MLSTMICILYIYVLYVYLKSELSEVNHQLSYQSDYCTSLGLVCCTLLWRASRNEQAVQEMIRGVSGCGQLVVVGIILYSLSE